MQGLYFLEKFFVRGQMAGITCVSVFTTIFKNTYKFFGYKLKNSVNPPRHQRSDGFSNE